LFSIFANKYQKNNYAFHHPIVTKQTTTELRLQHIGDTWGTQKAVASKNVWETPK
jgi:hypothetical protein